MTEFSWHIRPPGSVACSWGTAFEMQYAASSLVYRKGAVSISIARDFARVVT